MDICLSKTSVSCLKKVYEERFCREETAETVVPDVMPDIGEIICGDGSVYLRSKEVSAGRLTLTGTVSAVVLYLPEEGGCPRKLTVELPYSITAESPDITENCTAAATVRLAYLEARTLNPRKVHVRAGLNVCAACYEPAEITFGAEVPEECEMDLHTRMETVTVSPVAGVWEKTFVLTDEYPMPAGRSSAEELIGENVELLAEDAKLVGNKVIFKGTAKISLLWQGEDGNLESAAFSSNFSQILEIGGIGEAGELSDIQIELMPTGAYFELLPPGGGSKTVSMELHVLAQAICAQNRTLNYVSDAYSNAYPLELSCGEPERVVSESPLLLRDNMRGLVETPFSVREVVQTLADPGLWTETEDGFSCPIHVKLLLRDEEGVLRGVVRSFTAKFPNQADDETEMTLRSVYCGELYAAPATGGVEVRLVAEARAAVCTAVTISSVECVSADEENPVDLSQLPSVVILPGYNGDFWTLAKRYHSTVERIEAANSESGSGVLLIPRAR